MSEFSLLSAPAALAMPAIRYLNVSTGVARALTLARLTQAHQGSSVIITPDTPTALALEAELSYLLPAANVVLFPDRETLPYDSFSPHQDLVSQRLAALSRLASG
ncbi:MAG: hypothetical protein ACRCT7_05405, partial [Shewanella sp.]